MKRLLTLTAAMLSLVLVLSLCACGNDAEPAEETTEEVAESVDAPDTAETVAVDLAALRDQLVADCGITDYVDVETDALTNLYGIDAAQVASSASFSAASNGAFPQEIVMVQAVDEAAASDIGEKLNNRLNAIAEQAASYDPDSLELAENCSVVSSGAYVGMFFSEHYDAMESAFQDALR